MEQNTIIKEDLWKPLLTILLFLTMQMVFGILAIIVGILFHNGESGELPPASLAIATILANLTTALIITKMLGMPDLRETCRVHGKRTDKRWWFAISAGILAFLTGTFATNLMSEQFALEDEMKEEFIAMAHNWAGIISIAFIGPIMEEFIFREGITGFLLRKGKSPVFSILFSSLIFGFIHMNPAQIPFACLSGILLGVLYWKTRNILLCGAMHILNNSMAVWQMNLTNNDDQDSMMTELLGGPDFAWICTGILTAICLVALFAFCKLYPYTPTTNLHE